METVMQWVRLARIAACLSLGQMGCAPLTFSSEPALDFTAYPSVRVEVMPTTQHASYAERYLTERLAETSGFERVTSDARVRTHVVLEVDVSVSLELETDEEGDIDSEYLGLATYAARTPGGTVIDSGSVEDRSGTELEAIEDVLDELEYRYLAPYRY